MSLGLLGMSDPQSVAALADLLRQEEELALAAAGALDLLGEAARAAIPALEDLLLDSPSRKLEEAAGLALIRIDPEAVAPLAARIRPSDPELAAWLLNMAVLSRL